MKIAIIGATGQTGYTLCSQALEKGHSVVALVRTPEKMNGLTSENLSICQADALNEDSLVNSLTGVDAVISCIGSKFALPWKEESLYSTTIVVIVNALRRMNITRLIVMSAAMLRSEVQVPINIQNPWTMFRKAVRTVAVSHLKDMERMENFLLQNCDDIEYTIIRPYALISKPMSKREVAIETDVDQLSNSAFHIYRENLAVIMLQCVEEGLWVKNAVCIAMRE